MKTCRYNNPKSGGFIRLYLCQKKKMLTYTKRRDQKSELQQGKTISLSVYVDESTRVEAVAASASASLCRTAAALRLEPACC